MPKRSHLSFCAFLPTRYYQYSSHGQLTFRADDRREEKSVAKERHNEVFKFITPLAELGMLGVKEEQGGQ